jgi:hypothetical protein
MRYLYTFLKNNRTVQAPVLTAVILATQEAEIRRITVQKVAPANSA